MSAYGRALAIGILECKSDLIARMDSDDIAVKNRCEKQLDIFKNTEKIDIVGSCSYEFKNNVENIVDYRTVPETNEQIYKFARRRCPFIHSSVMFRKSKILEAGNYQDYQFCEDYELWIRLIKLNATCYNIQENLVYTRLDNEYYKRRGGLKYLKKILYFKYLQYRKKFYSLNDFIITVTATVFTSMLPTKLREIIYTKKLRTTFNKDIINKNS